MVRTRGQMDEKLRQVVDALRSYEAGHPDAKVEAYRDDASYIRIRIIDPDFKGRRLGVRDTAVWHILDRLPADVTSDITMLLLLTPAEVKKSFANRDFEHPTPCPPELLEIIEKGSQRNGGRNARR